MALFQQYDGASGAMTWYDTETGMPVVWSAPGQSVTGGNGGTWSNASNPASQAMGGLRASLDAAPMVDLSGAAGPSANAPWYFANGKYYVPQIDYGLDPTSGMPTIQDSGFEVGNGAFSFPTYSGGRNVRISGGPANSLYGIELDTQPGTRSWQREAEGSFFGNVLSNLITGPGVPGAGFFGAGAFNSGGLGNFLSSFGGGTGGAAGVGVGGGAGGVSGGGMFDPLADFGFDYFSGAGNYNLPYGDAIEGLIDLTNQGMSGSQAVQSLSQMNPAWTQSTLEFLANNPSQIGSYLNNMGSIRNLLSGDGIGGLGLNGLRGLVPSGGGFMDQALSSLPVLAAIDYAKSQGPFDTSRLEGLYDQYKPGAAAFSYDQNTQAGRRALEGSLQSRGVLGSSFGNMDLTNFDTTRELGRNALVNQSAGVAGGLASNILDAQVKSRALKNDLYGRSLLALGNVFGGRQSPTFSLGGF